nr:hypothetical protein BaRGS_010072 [Batillaria attramentaria]
MEQGPSNSQDHDSQELADDTQNIQDDQDQDDDSFNDGASTSAVSSGSSNLSKTVWSHNGILLLIEAYRQKRHYLDDPTKRRSEMWTAISAIMRSKGHVITPEACNKKMDNLRQRYKMIKDRNGRTGAGRSSWPYFEKMDQVLGKDPDVTPPVVVSSLNGRKEADAEPSEGEFSSTRTGSPTTPLCGLLQKKRQEKKSGPPQWLKDYEERQDQRLQKLVSVGEKRNSLLEKLIEKLG